VHEKNQDKRMLMVRAGE